jgi:hypothetical protein
MGAKDKKKKDQTASFTTHIGSVTGPVHTGSGDINIGDFSVSGNISTQVEFLAYLKSLRSEIEKVQQKGVADEPSQQATDELKEAEREAGKDKPQAQKLRSHLENAKKLLISAAGVATAAKPVIDAIQSVAQYIDPAIQAISKLFH